MTDASSLPSTKRYEYFLEQIANQHSLWSLRDADGWCTVANEKDQTCFPVWPAAQFASAWATDEFASCIPTEITVEDWLGPLHKAAVNCRWKIAVFPTDDDPGELVDPNRFAKEIGPRRERHE